MDFDRLKRGIWHLIAIILGLVKMFLIVVITMVLTVSVITAVDYVGGELSAYRLARAIYYLLGGAIVLSFCGGLLWMAYEDGAKMLKWYRSKYLKEEEE